MKNMMTWVTKYHGWVEIFTSIYLLSVCKCWRCALDLIVVETSLTFAWCTCYLHGVWRWLDLEDSWGSWLSSWCVEMVFFEVYGDGCILRTNSVLGKGVVYVFIWHVILGIKMVSFFMSWYTLDTCLDILHVMVCS